MGRRYQHRSPIAAPPHIVAIAVWARGLGLARRGRTAEAAKEIDKLRQIEEQLRRSGSDYWATQTGILSPGGYSMVSPSGRETGRSRNVDARGSR